MSATVRQSDLRTVDPGTVTIDEFPSPVTNLSDYVAAVSCALDDGAGGAVTATPTTAPIAH